MHGDIPKAPSKAKKADYQDGEEQTVETVSPKQEARNHVAPP